MEQETTQTVKSALEKVLDELGELVKQNAADKRKNKLRRGAGLGSLDRSSSTEMVNYTVQETEQLLEKNPGGQEMLMDYITQCFDVFGNYRREQQQVANVVKIFQEVLTRYEVRAIARAFKKYIKIGKYMPKPADILDLIAQDQKENPVIIFNAREHFSHLNTAWRTHADKLRKMIGDSTYKAWFSDFDLVEVHKDGKLVFSTSTKFKAIYIMETFNYQIAESLNGEDNFRIIVDEDKRLTQEYFKAQL